MSKTNKKFIGALLLSWVVAGGIVRFLVSDDWATLLMTITFTILVIRMVIISDKKERLEKSKEFQAHRLIYATIDGVVEIQKQGDRTYKVYTDTDIYMAEYGKTTSKIIHVGDYQRVDMEG